MYMHTILICITLLNICNHRHNVISSSYSLCVFRQYNKNILDRQAFNAQFQAARIFHKALTVTLSFNVFVDMLIHVHRNPMRYMR